MMLGTGDGDTKGYSNLDGHTLGVDIQTDNERIVTVVTYRRCTLGTWVANQRARLVSISSKGDIRTRE
jgi:hypothetical protein